MNIVIIKAGGIGSRMGAEIPKQFIKVKNKPIIIYTLEAFQKHPMIDDIVVVCVEDWIEKLWGYVKEYNITKVSQIVSGGSTSLRSIQNGINAIKQRNVNRDDYILIHDANRPLVSQYIISDVIQTGYKYGTAVAAVQCTDEVMKSVDEEASTTFLNRKELFRIQTPDLYKLKDISYLINHASEKDFEYVGATNTLWIAHGGTMHFAKGSELNIRLTKQEDIVLFEAILDLNEEKK